MAHRPRPRHPDAMQTRAIGSLQASVVGLGCNNFGMRIDQDAACSVVDAAIDAGINFFDTADIYGGTRSEEFLGRALGTRRDQVLVATKFGVRIDDDHPGGASAAYIVRACEDSLRRLGTDRIDLYQLHVPDPATPLEETLGALDALVRAGKVREVGCSNFSVEMIEESSRISADREIARFVSVQNEYSLLRRGPEKQGVLDACVKHDLAFIPYFPLASGVLSGKYKRGQAPPAGTRLANMPAERRDAALSDDRLARVEALDAWARDHGRSLLELAFAWLLARPAVASVIAGATKPEQARANAAASSWTLSGADLAEIDAVIERVKSSS
jgi:aryl-alcohol dehydrogenase-like predicted oxidoreductase